MCVCPSDARRVVVCKVQNVYNRCSVASILRIEFIVFAIVAFNVSSFLKIN